MAASLACQLRGDHGFAFIEPAGQLRHLGQLLHGEGEPGFHLRVERVLLRQIDRNVEQAARGATMRWRAPRTAATR